MSIRVIGALNKEGEPLVQLRFDEEYVYTLPAREARELAKVIEKTAIEARDSSTKNVRFLD